MCVDKPKQPSNGCKGRRQSDCKSLVLIARSRGRESSEYLGPGKVLMSSPASYSATYISPAKDPGLSLKRAPAGIGDEAIKKTERCRGLIPSPPPKSVSVPFISMRQIKEPGMHWEFLPVSYSYLFACLNEPVFQMRVNPPPLKGP